MSEERFRLNRGGNRQANAAIHRIAITQIRIHPNAQTFIKRRLEHGSTNEKPSDSSNANSPTSSTEPCSQRPNNPPSPPPLDIGETHLER